MIDTIDLIVKLLVLFFLAATSELSFKKRSWGLMFLALGVWLTIFRAAILRASVIYAGVFNHTSQEVIKIIQKGLMSGSLSLVTDVIALIGSIIVFVFVAAEMKKKVTI